MKTYELEARLPGGKWVGVGSGEFKSFTEASEKLDDINWPRDNLRIKPIGAIDMDKIATCECGGKCFSHEKQTICDSCRAVQ